MGHQRRMLDETLDGAETLGKSKQADALEEALGAGEIAVEFGGDHAAEGAHLAPRDVVLRMALEAGIKDAADIPAPFEPFGDGNTVLRMPLHPQRQGLEP